MTDKLPISPRGTRGRRVTTFFFKLLSPLAGSQISRYRKNRRVVKDSPQYASYRKVTDREIPVVRLKPV